MTSASVAFVGEGALLCACVESAIDIGLTVAVVFTDDDSTAALVLLRCAGLADAVLPVLLGDTTALFALTVCVALLWLAESETSGAGTTTVLFV